jgi:hypothetical protein
LRFALLLALAATGAAIQGCGSGPAEPALSTSDARQIEMVIEDFQTAIRERDTGRACALMTKSTRQDRCSGQTTWLPIVLARSEIVSVDLVVGEDGSRRVEVGMQGRRAGEGAGPQFEITLEQLSGAWRISGFPRVRL